jgi:hypothetical protein
MWLLYIPPLAVEAQAMAYNMAILVLLGLHNWYGKRAGGKSSEELSGLIIACIRAFGHGGWMTSSIKSI